MNKITSEIEFKEICQNDGFHVFMFTTKWCGDCIYIKPFLPSIENQFSNMNFYELDRDDCLDLAREMDILGIPSFVCYKDGKEISRFVSSLRKTKEEIVAYLEKTVREA